ncbi:MAG: MFS transporter [Sporichthyaceae bacterium]
MLYGRSALTVIGMAVALVVSQQLVLSIALPQVTADLEASQTELQWILDSYPVALAALLLPGGALGDRLGRRRMLLVGLVLMTGANVGLALAGSAPAAVAWRVACAIGAALVFPATLSTLTTAFSGERRDRAVAVWSIAAIIGAFFGLLGAGLLMEFWSWRSICWASAILGAVLLPAVRLVVPESERNPEVVLDPLGSLLAVLGVGATTFGIIEAGVHGLLDVRALGGLLGGLALTGWFLRRQWRAERPLLNVRKLVGVTVGLGLIGCTALFFAIYALAFTTIQFLSAVHGLSALQIGLALMSYAVLVVPLTFLSSRVARRVGVGPLIVFGLLVISVGYLLFATLDADDSLGTYIAMAVLFGGGIGFMQAPATAAVVEALPNEEQGLASAVNDITRELGAALGIAVSGAVLIANLRPAATPAETFMTAWPATNVAMAVAAALCALAVGALARFEPRPEPRRGRHRAGGRPEEPDLAATPPTGIRLVPGGRHRAPGPVHAPSRVRELAVLAD